MIQVLPLPRQISRAVIWSIYGVTCLGLIVTIALVFLVYRHEEQGQFETEIKQPRELQSRYENYSSKDTMQKLRLDRNENISKFDMGSSSATKTRRQQEQSRPRVRPGFVTLEEIVAYECHYQTTYQKTNWLEDSDTEISYVDELGQTRVMNVLTGQTNPLEVAEQRVVKQNSVPWMGNDHGWKREISREDALTWNCPAVWECWLNCWILSKSPNNNCTTTKTQYRANKALKSYPQHSISLWDHCPSFCTHESNFIPHRNSRHQDVDPLGYPEAVRQRVFQANGLMLLSSHRHRRDLIEWKEPTWSYERLHVTKMFFHAKGELMYFVAAPVSNVSLRFLYSGDDATARCLTCPGVASLECLSSDAMPSKNARYYILYCRGPEVPWTAVVSSETNEMIYRLDNQERSRDWYASRPRPVGREFDVKLDAQHNARVRLHLPTAWSDDGECGERRRILLRIGDEQNDQLVDAQFDFSLMNYLTTVKGYAVVYADVRASEFQSWDYRRLRFRRRELMQMRDYTTVIVHILKHWQCLEQKVVGVFGENYGAHMALNLLADNHEGKLHVDGDDKFRCCVAVEPTAKWQDYVYPFNDDHSSGVTGVLRKKMFKRRYMAALVGRLRGKHLAVHTWSHRSHQRAYYTRTLLKLLNRYAVKFEHHQYLNDGESTRTCDSRLKLYERASDFFDRCFGREIDAG